MGLSTTRLRFILPWNRPQRNMFVTDMGNEDMDNVCSIIIDYNIYIIIDYVFLVM